MKKTQTEQELKALCRTLRKDILNMIHKAGSGHPGGSLSSVEILTVLYNHVMRVDPENPNDPKRDRMILSKGHIAPILYAVLARKGYFGIEILDTLRKLGSPLQGHPYAAKLPGLDCSSGSLGQGLSIANGLAIAARKTGADYRTYCLLGDGELQEGQVWEAAMTAAHYNLDNVCAIVDYNGVQLDGTTKDIMNIDPVADKWRTFNWNVVECDGHEVSDLIDAFEQAEKCKGKPTVIVARCIKGKGVSFMENQAAWHGAAPNAEQLAQALSELE
ncbi:MAG: transketolase [Clostridiaceae bacterium]|jgi:transketolase|nr:transketolase [Clostridiaceae bacterium]